MKVLERLAVAINAYDVHRDTMTTEELQDVRDEISLCLYYMADLHAALRASSDLAEYERKHALASKFDEYKTDPPGGKRLSNEHLRELCVIEAASFYEKERDASKEYDKIRQLFASCNQILNAIATRLSLHTR